MKELRGVSYGGVAIGLTVLLTFLVFSGTAIDLTEQSWINYGDQRLNMIFQQWCLDWVYGRTPPGTTGFWNQAFYYPYAQTTALSSNHLGSLPLLLLLDGFTGDWLFRGNLWIIATFLLNSLAAFHSCFILFREDHFFHRHKPLTLWLVATSLSLSFAFSLTRTGYIDHSQTLPHFAFPYFLLYFYLGLKTGESRKMVLSGLFFAWQAYLDLHLAINSAFLTLLVTPLFVGFGMNSSERGLGLKSLIRQSSVFLGVVAVTTAPLIWPYLETAAEFGYRVFERGLSLRYYFKPPVYSTLFTDLLPIRTANEQIILPHYLFIPGVLFFALGTLYLAVRGFWRFFKTRERTQLRAALLSLALLVALAIYMDFMVHRSLLARFFFEVIPGLSSVRAPNRFSILLGPLFLGLWIFPLLAHRGFPKVARWFHGALVVFLVGVTLEAATLKFPVWDRPRHPELAGVFTELKGPAIFLPFDLSPYEQLDIMTYAMQHKMKVGNGYSGFEPHRFGALRKRSRTDSFAEIYRDLKNTDYQEIVVDTRRMPVNQRLATQAIRVGPYLIFPGFTKQETAPQWTKLP